MTSPLSTTSHFLLAESKDNQLITSKIACVYDMFSSACSITDYESDTVILTGGYTTTTISKVERYGHSGLKETLPDLNEPRRMHGCSSYIKDGKQVSINAKDFESCLLNIVLSMF